jgi:predicted GNAT family acetyltransferase
MTSPITVRDNAEARTYEASDDGNVVGTLVYEVEGHRIVLSHTFVEPSSRGNGIATELVARALDDIRAKGMTVTVLCGFAVDFFSTHTGYADLVDKEHPGRVVL